MPKLLPTQALPRIGDIKDPAALEYAEKMNRFLDQLIRKVALADNIAQVQQLEIVVGTNTGGSGPNWLIREATTADVSAGNAATTGNLLISHRTGGVRTEFEQAD